MNILDTARYQIPGNTQRLILQVLKRIVARVPQSIERLGLAGNSAYPVPYAWQLVVEYLYRQGIVQLARIDLEEPFADEPKVHSLRLWATPSPSDGESVISRGGYSRGVSDDFSEAIAKVIGELLERYPLTLYRDAELHSASIGDLREQKQHFLDPYLADQFSPWQKERFPRRVFDERSVFRWVKGKSFTKDIDAYIPAQMVFINYKYAKGEPVLRQPISNGAAGMFTFEEAVLAGLYELIQRDAFLVRWLANEQPPAIDPDSIIDARLRFLMGDAKRCGLEVRILDTTSDIGIPAFVAVLLDRSGRGPAVVLGGGCGFDQEKAILRALTEALGVRSALRRAYTYRTEPLPKFSDVEPFTKDWDARERLFLWYSRESIDRIMPFVSGPVIPLDLSKNKSFLNPREELAHIMQIFAERGDAYEIFVYQAQHKLLKTLGYVSVKVCVPALLPLYLRETFAPLGAKRLKSSVTNTIPHPFP